MGAHVSMTVRPDTETYARAQAVGEHVATVGVDDLVGERGIVTATPRAADVVVTSHLAAYVLSRSRLAEVMTRNPGAAATMREVTAARYPSSGA